MLQRPHGDPYQHIGLDRKGLPRYQMWFNFCEPIGVVLHHGQQVCDWQTNGCLRDLQTDTNYFLGNGFRDFCAWNGNETASKLTWIFSGKSSIADPPLMVTLVCDWAAWPPSETRLVEDPKGASTPPIGHQSLIMYSRCGCRAGPCDPSATLVADVGR
jgi:hypothetical protein